MCALIVRTVTLNVSLNFSDVTVNVSLNFRKCDSWCVRKWFARVILESVTETLRLLFFFFFFSKTCPFTVLLDHAP